MVLFTYTHSRILPNSLKMLQIKMKALHYSCWTNMSTLSMCVKTQFLCSLASVHRVWLRVVCNLGQKKETVACEIDPLFIIGTNQRRSSYCPWYLYRVSFLKTDNVIRRCPQDWNQTRQDSAEYEDYWGAAEMDQVASGTQTGRVPLHRKQRKPFGVLSNLK